MIGNSVICAKSGPKGIQFCSVLRRCWKWVFFCHRPAVGATDLGSSVVPLTWPSPWFYQQGNRLRGGEVPAQVTQPSAVEADHEPVPPAPTPGAFQTPLFSQTSQARPLPALGCLPPGCNPSFQDCTWFHIYCVFTSIISATKHLQITSGCPKWILMQMLAKV